MDRETLAALDSINQRFYASGARDFDRTRANAWPGWNLLWQRLAFEDGPRRVLDAGCGNARFLTFLAQAIDRRPSSFTYLGLDASPQLLAAAAERGRELPGFGEIDLRAFNLLGHDYRGCPPVPSTEQFDLVVSFGVLHHVPVALQEPLLERLWEATAPGGTLVCSVWQFARLERFLVRRLPWEWAVVRGWMTADQAASLTESDWLLRWGPDTEEHARYCRDNSPSRLIAMLRALDPSSRVDSFAADGASGALNRYLLVQRPETGAP